MPIQVVANSYLGRTYVALGECRKAIRYCGAALALIPEDLQHERFGQGSIQTVYARYTLGALGQFPEAFGHLSEALEIAEDAGHEYSLLFPLLGLGTLKVEQGDFAGAVAPLERGLDLSTTGQIIVLLDLFAWARGAAYHGIGRQVEGPALMEDAARSFAEGLAGPLVGGTRRGAR
jgi:tetratricopeptide (TPR) repeat protein